MSRLPPRVDELVDGGRPVGVGRDQHRLAALPNQMASELGR